MFAEVSKQGAPKHMAEMISVVMGSGFAVLSGIHSNSLCLISSIT